MTERDIQNILYKYLKERGHTMITPNAAYMFCNGWECDLVSVTKSGFMHEYEIKISLSDFKADFNKPNGKHETLKKRIKDIPSRFWYVTYGFAVSISDIPEYAGLIEISHTVMINSEPSIMVSIEAPLLTKEKITEKQKDALFRVTNNKYWLERLRSDYD